MATRVRVAGLRVLITIMPATQVASYYPKPKYLSVRRLVPLRIFWGRRSSLARRAKHVVAKLSEISGLGA